MTVLATLTLATTALGGSVAAQSPSAAPDASMAAASGPNLFNTTYPERFVAPADGQTGGTLIFADWQEATLFNPYYFNQVTEANVTTATQAGLITSTDDFKYAPDLAVSIPTTDNGGVVTNADGTITITWTLREGLKWSDGTPLACDDYSFTNDWIIDAANTGLPAGKTGYLTDAGLAAYGASGVVNPADINLTVACPSATEMVWTLAEPYAGYLTLLPVPLQRAYNSQFTIADMITGKGWSASEVAAAPISGPFKYGTVTPGQQLDLVRNESYADNLTGKPAFLDGVTFKWYGDADTMIAAYQGANPEYDVATDLTDADIPKLDGLDKVLAIDALTYEFLRPNWDPDHCSLLLQPARNGACPASDPAIREALKYAIDKQAINVRLLGGNAAIAQTNTSPNAWFYVAPTTADAQDQARASAVLAAAGWVADPNTGFLFKNVDGDFTCDNDPDGAAQTGDPATACGAFPAADDGSFPSSSIKDYTKGDYDAKIELCTTTRQLRQDTLAMVAGFLNQVGIQAVISPVSPSDIFAAYNESTDQTACALSRGNFDVAEHAFSVPLDPLSNYPVYSSNQFPPMGANDAKVNDPDIDAALNAVKTTIDFKTVLDSMATFQQIYQDKTVEVPLYFRKEVYLQSPALQNFTGNPTSTGPLWNAQHWFFGQ